VTTETTARIGAARVDITPDWPLPLAGFASRTTISQGVAHPLHLRVALLESTGTRALIASADLLNWGPERLPEWRKALSASCGVPEGSVLFSATHSHSGPQTNGWHAAATGVLDPRFLDLLGERLLAVAAAAAADMEDVSIARGRGQHDLGMHRRVVVDGHAMSRPNPDGPVDHEVTVLAFRRADGSLKAALTHYTCHPVLSGEDQLSGEFTGDAMSRVEERTGAVSLYLQGCCGDTNPGRLASTGLAEIPKQGAALADVVSGILDGALEELRPVPLTARWDGVDLPFKSAPTTAELQEASTQDGVMGQWGRAFLEHPERIAASARLELQRLEIAEGQALLAMNGEVCLDYGLQIKAVSGGRVLPVAYSNGMIGYIPTATQVDEGGYEADESTRYYLLAGRFARELDPLIRAHTVPLATG
jgi:hypothetical protein